MLGSLVRDVVPLLVGRLKLRFWPAAISTLACTNVSRSAEKLTDTDSIPVIGVAELVQMSRGRSVAVLVIEPRDCLTCNSAVPQWINVAGKVGAERAPIVLARKPTSVEWRSLRLARVPIVGVFLDMSPVERDGTAYILVLSEGQVVRTINLRTTAELGTLIQSLFRLDTKVAEAPLRAGFESTSGDSARAP